MRERDFDIDDVAERQEQLVIRSSTDASGRPSDFRRFDLTTVKSVDCLEKGMTRRKCEETFFVFFCQWRVFFGWGMRCLRLS